MKPLTITDAKTIVLGLQDEIRRSEESRYDHHLHRVLLVAQGLTCPEVSRLLGDAPRTIEYWVRRFEERGTIGTPPAAERCPVGTDPLGPATNTGIGRDGRRPVGWQRIGRLYQEAVSGNLGRPPVPIHL